MIQFTTGDKDKTWNMVIKFLKCVLNFNSCVKWFAFSIQTYQKALHYPILQQFWILYSPGDFESPGEYL